MARSSRRSRAVPQPNLLILPGLLEDADAFAAVIAGLGGRAHCVVADLTRSDTIAGLARDALAQAPPGPISLAGHSMGGYVALEAVRQAPARIERLALLHTNAGADSPESTGNRRRLLSLAERDFRAVIAALLPRQMTPAHLEDTVLAGIVDTMALAVGKEAFARQQEAIIHRIDSRSHLAAIRCPTAVIAAREDQIMPLALLQEIADGISGARLTVIEDCGHMSTIEQPARVSEALVEWLERKTK
jgi:pimeloyl-ACP methyl ester carboxylesterase